MNTGSRSLKQHVMEDEEELLREVLTVASLAFWFVLLLKLAEVAPFVFWLVPFLEGTVVGEVVPLICWIVLFLVLLNEVVFCGLVVLVVVSIWTSMQPDITTSSTTQLSTLRAISPI